MDNTAADSSVAVVSLTEPSLTANVVYLRTNRRLMNQTNSLRFGNKTELKEFTALTDNNFSRSGWPPTTSRRQLASVMIDTVTHDLLYR